MRKVIVIIIGIILYSTFIGITNKVKESEIYKSTKPVFEVGKEFAGKLMNKDIFADNDLVKINDIDIRRHISTMVVNFLVENKSSNTINIALEDVKLMVYLEEYMKLEMELILLKDTEKIYSHHMHC